MKKRSKSTYLQIAELAKVSPATVSRVATGNSKVDPALQQRIRKAAASLGCDLEKKRNDRARTIAFVLANKDTLSPFHTQILVGAEAYCSTENWELRFKSYRYSPDSPSRDLTLSQILGPSSTVRGAILGGTNHPNMLEALRERGIPFSVLGNNVTGDWDPDHYNTVFSDDVQGARDLTLHLIAGGHRDIWFIGDAQLPWYSRCVQGYRESMIDAGLQPRFSNIRSDEGQLGYLATRSIISGGEPVSAVFAGTDQVAAGVYDALRQCGMRVPEDISVAGFNNTDSKLLHPAATTVMEFPQEIGRHLAEFVLRRIKNPALKAQQMNIATQVVVRESTRPMAIAESRTRGKIA
ncbi:MAG: LacI family DNA-binding transcriptional regulator [Acidobacteriota bacterium]